MILISIPKSASESLQKTLCKSHNLEYPNKSHTQKIITKKIVEEWDKKSALHRVHLFPYKRNQNLLKGKKIVVLLRKPDEIMDAYDRGIKYGIHHLKTELKYYRELWGEKHIFDFEGFYYGWLNQRSKNVLVIMYKDLVSNPKKIVNKLERFFELTESKKVRLKKEHYTKSVFINFKRECLFLLKQFLRGEKG